MVNINELKLFTICENSSANIGFLGEWGLSILIDIDGSKILFDTGMGQSILPNTELLKIDLSTIDKIVLSHGHADHTGGLIPVLQQVNSKHPGKEIEIIAHPDILADKYYQRYPEEAPFYQGVPFSVEEVETLGGVLKLSSQPVWLNDYMVISGEVPMSNDFEAVSDGCLQKRNGTILKDPLADDMAIYIKTNLGLVVISGCAHRGIINTIHHGQKITGLERVYMVVGGTHLAAASDYQLSSTIKELNRLNINKLGASHCTGMASACRLSSEFGNNFFHNNAGTGLSFVDNEMQLKAF